MLNMVIMALAMVVAPVKPQASKCETYAPRTDGISVTVCGGTVTKYCDQSGNCLEPGKY